MPENVKCPCCEVELKVKSVIKCKDGGSDIMGLCEECLRTWKWHRDAKGNIQSLEQYFFG